MQNSESRSSKFNNLAGYNDLNKDLGDLNPTEYLYLEEILHDCILLSKLKIKRDSFK